MEVFSFILGSTHYIVSFVVVLSVVVFVHEYGHYWVARRSGVKIDTFSIGFGKEIFGWNDRHGTRWTISWLPLGGYVKMFGDADPSSSRPGEKVKVMTEEEKKVSFWHKDVSVRMAVTAAGPVFNYIFALIVMAFLFMISGQPFTPPVAGTIMENSAASRAGMLVNDRVLSIDGSKIDKFEDIKRTVSLNMGTPMSMEIERDGKIITLMATPEVVLSTDRLGGEHHMGRLGMVSHEIEFKKHSPLPAVGYALMEVWEITAGTFKAIGQMVMGTRGTEELGGPLRIAEMSGQVTEQGISTFFWFLAVISINLGLINFFPIPLLDGGNLVFYIAEFLRGRPLGENVQEAGSRVGLFLVVSLMVFATWNDLVHLRVISYLNGLFS